MKFLSATTRIGCGAAVMLCCTFASAQGTQRYSEDYQQAYRAGYEAGYRQAQREQRRGPERVGISVTSASYGADGTRARCDATTFVRAEADGQRNATIDIDNSMCGDPSPGRRKAVQIAYNCGTVSKTASGFEGSQAYLSCEAHVGDRYGR